MILTALLLTLAMCTFMAGVLASVMAVVAVNEGDTLRRVLLFVTMWIMCWFGAVAIALSLAKLW